MNLNNTRLLFKIFRNKLSVYAILIKELFCLYFRNAENKEFFCLLQKVMPDDTIANWALGLAVEKLRISATDMKRYIDLPQHADHEIRNWNLTEIALNWEFSLMRAGIKTPPNGERRIAIVSAYHQITTLYLAVAIVLIRKGHCVDLVLAERGQHDATPDLKWERCLVGNELSLLRDTLDIEKLTIHRISEYPKSKIYESLAKVIEQQSLEDLQQSIQDPFPDFSDKVVKKIHAFRMKSNQDFGARFLSLAKQIDIDHWIIDSGSWAEYGVGYKVLEDLGAEIICPGSKTEKERIIISHNRAFNRVDTSIAWQHELTHGLSDQERQNILQEMIEREGPSFYQDKAHFVFQRTEKQATADLRHMLGLDEERPIILMLPNNSWDTGLLTPHAHHAFPSLKEWAIQTVKFFKEHADFQLIVRAHTGEHIFDSNDRIDQNIRRAIPDLPEFIHVLDSDTDLNTYALMELSDLVIAYTSNVAWEATLRGVPAICAGNGHFTDYEFVRGTQTSEAYFALLHEFIAKPSTFNVSEEHREQALAYGNLFCNVLPKAFPWSHFRVFASLEENPMDYVISEEGLDKFSESFDILAFEQDLPYGMLGRSHDSA